MAKQRPTRTLQETARPFRRRFVLLRLILAALVLYAAGFGFFAAGLPTPAAPGTANADAIVALTGEGDRLGPAVSLLESGRGQRLLITGVNRRTTKTELKSLLHAGRAFDCCADLGFAAVDTRGNAVETAEWARAHHYASLVVVTADYHMPRSLLEFAAEMPEIRLVPYPVVLEALHTPRWQNVRRLHGEYAKFLASWIRVTVSSALRDA